MGENRVEITDSKGQSMKILVQLHDRRKGTWRSLDCGFFCQENGVANTGIYPASPLAWIAFYGGESFDDHKLVLHLDDFQNGASVQAEGKGWVYPQDHLLIEPGEVNWRLVG